MCQITTKCHVNKRYRFRSRLPLVFVFIISCYSGEALTQEESIFNKSLDELLSFELSSSATLTPTPPNKVPARTTIITSEMIRQSGARNLDELLEIYVPNLQRSKHGATGVHLGIRGIISDLDNKLLILVNGRVTNHLATYGAISERYLSMLGDIESIEVARGPGSAIFGPGAISGVIHIRTFSAKTFAGNEVVVKKGEVENFWMSEFRKTVDVNDGLSLFMSVSIDDYHGASADDAPVVYSKSSSFFSAGEHNSSASIVNDNSSRNEHIRHKVHVQASWATGEAWLRSVKAGTQYVDVRHRFESMGSFEQSKRGIGYHHITAALDNQLHYSDDLAINLRVTFDQFDVVQDADSFDVLTSPDYENTAASGESRATIATQIDAKIDDHHSFSALLEAKYGRFSESAQLVSDDPPHNIRNELKPFSTVTYGLATEYQYIPTDDWRLFVGARIDYHSLASWMVSPKLSLVYSPNIYSDFKLVLNRGTRKSEELVLRNQVDDNIAPDIEKIMSQELIYSRYLDRQKQLHITAFRYKHDLLGFLPQKGTSAEIGTMNVNGLEIEFASKAHHLDWNISHSYTQLHNFELKFDELRNQVQTAEPYGYGDDLANWSPHISKANFVWHGSENWKFNGSLVIYWGFPGAEDYTRYNNEVLMASNRSQSEGETNAFDTSARLNLGVSYSLSPRITVGLHAHNALGWADKELNKNNFYARMAGYRIEAASISASLNIRF
ncbi:TonB-dependent receptor [Alteromonas sp. ASW11-36]|uniref:TonB-dependent receptor n=2 Tax=Alteromonas arenosi TaxID=3055817 RepID=A0ABT7SWH7_9ALTE|nr:TonB-dependent receptor [Alteromonas sp. ASW11-36]MDM7860374.1 TonB-dependent receptor [Alteromonas sp. ASW11-36]